MTVLIYKQEAQLS